jgi:hypothetical protein
MKYLSLNLSRKACIRVNSDNLTSQSDIIDEIAARIVDITGKPDYTFDYIVNYLVKVYPYWEVEDNCAFTPAEMRSLRAMRSFLTYVINHGRKAPAGHVWCDLNTGKNICLINTSTTEVNWLEYQYDFREIVEREDS